MFFISPLGTADSDGVTPHNIEISSSRPVVIHVLTSGLLDGFTPLPHAVWASRYVAVTYCQEVDICQIIVVASTNTDVSLLFRLFNDVRFGSKVCQSGQRWN